MISIVTPVFNYGHFLKDTFVSLQKQSYQHWEWLIVDDGSTDSTAEIVKEMMQLDSRIKYFYQKNQGPNAARNLGLRSAKGTFIQFLDADDQLEDDKLKAQLEIIRANPNIDLVIAGTVFQVEDAQRNLRTNDNKLETIFRDEQVRPAPELLPFLVEQNIFTNNSPIVRKSILQTIGYCDETLKQLEDWIMWLKILLNSNLVAYHKSAGSNAVVRIHWQSNGSNSLKMHMGRVLARNLLANYLQQFNYDAIERRNHKLLRMNKAQLADLLMHVKTENEKDLNAALELLGPKFKLSKVLKFILPVKFYKKFHSYLY